MIQPVSFNPSSLMLLCLKWERDRDILRAVILIHERARVVILTHCAIRHTTSRRPNDIRNSLIPLCLTYSFMVYVNWSEIHHCVKSVQMRSYFCSVFSCIRIEYGPDITPYLDTFHAVLEIHSFNSHILSMAEPKS